MRRAALPRALLLPAASKRDAIPSFRAQFSGDAVAPLARCRRAPCVCGGSSIALASIRRRGNGPSRATRLHLWTLDRIGALSHPLFGTRPGFRPRPYRSVARIADRPSRQVAKCEDRYNKAKAVHRVMRHVAEKHTMILQRLYAQVRSWPDAEGRRLVADG